MGFFSKNKKNKIDFFINTDETANTSGVLGDKNLAPHAITAQEISDFSGQDKAEQHLNHTNALDALKNRMKSNISQTNNQETTTVDTSEKGEEKSLLDKLHRYTVDEQGHDLSKVNEPLYQLESVTEILKSKSENSIKNLSKKYDVFVDDLGKSTQQKAEQPTDKTNDIENEKTFVFEQMVTEAERREEEELYKNVFEPETVVKENQNPLDLPDISDIDNREYGINSQENVSDTATIRFTPIKDSKGNTDHITISNVTKHIDLDDIAPDAININSTELQQTEFELFKPKSEITDFQSGKKFLRNLAIKKRSAFLSVFVSTIVTLALMVFLIPAVFDVIISNTKSAMIICTAFLLISTLANYTMFFGVAKLLNKKLSADIFACTAAIFTLSLSVCAASTNSNAYYIILLCSIILWFRSISNFKLISAKHGNLRQILNSDKKNAVTLIDDNATTFAMAKNTIDGDVLVCSHKKANFIEDFMKHWEFTDTLSKKHPFLFYATVLLDILCAMVAYFYYDSIFTAFYCAACLCCISAIPTLFFIDAFPLSSATKKLNQKGTMIAGLQGAELIENANAAYLSINDIFPKGTISMYSMQVLSNNIDQTILKAASLTAAVGSPLEAIFNKIAGTNSSYSMPDSDTVKYEKRLGISGWVDNELLFIGNRSLMEAHGISIPSVEIDKKILRKGFFPVYVATENTACALIVIQYDVQRDIAKELRKITELGVTLLIDNCDPNINEEMICDYFGLYEDSVKIMTNAGVCMHRNATPDVERCSSPAAFRGSALNFIKIINCASNIKKSNLILTILYALFAIFGIVYFVYASFSGLSLIPQSTTIIAYELIITFISIIGFLIRKP